MSSLNDRGTMKWTSIMMPEHVKMLNKLREEQNKVKRPILDEQKREEINFQLTIGFKDNLLVEVKYYEDGHFLTMRGYIQKVNYGDKFIEVSEDIGGKEFMRIKYEDILDVFIV